MSEVKTNTVARINNVDILVVENGEKRVAIKPICEALGITVQAQLDRLKDDPILSSVIMLSLTPGADGKQYQMQTIPFKYVFGWLFRIDSRNVKEEAREAVLKYQIECYDALYNHFTGAQRFLEEKEKIMSQLNDRIKLARKNFSTAKGILSEAEDSMDKAVRLSLEQYKESGFQMNLEM